jgi:MFS family permease
MRTYLRVLRNPSFRRLFLGQAASAVGDGVVLVAIALYVTETTRSASALGIVLCAQTVPLVALLLFGGVWADRLPRHRIMIVADLVRAALHAVLAVAILTGRVGVWELVAIEAPFGAARAFFQPAYSGLIPQTVSEEEIADARGLTEWMANLASLIGPALATVLVLGVGAGEAFAFDSATFLLSALALVRVRPRARGVTVRAESMLHELREGWREVRARTWVWVTISVFTGSLLCMFAQWYALAPRVARSVYGSAGVFGLLETVMGLGAVCGALASVHWHPARPLATGLAMTLIWPVQLAAFALGAPLALVGVCAFGTGWSFSLLMIWWETALAQHIPPRLLSRVSAYDWMGSLALLPVGYLIAGPAAHAIGARTVLEAGSAVGFVLLALALAPTATRRLQLNDNRAAQLSPADGPSPAMQRRG